MATSGASSSTIAGEFKYLPPSGRGSSVLGSTNDGRDSLTSGSLKGQGNFIKRWLGRSARNLSVISDKQGKLFKSRAKSEPNLTKKQNAVILDVNDEELTTNSNESETSEIK